MKSSGIKLVILLSLVLTGAISASLGGWLGYQSLEKSARNELFRYSSLIEDLINRFQVMSPILASNDQFKDLLLSPAPKSVEETNRQLSAFSDILNLSSDIYILNVQGRTLASSNWNTETSFIGRNFSFRPYYQQAMTGSSGFYFALGLATKVRGVYFSNPIKINDIVIGVMVLKINVSHLEELWKVPESSETFEFVVTDRDSIIFLSSQADWRYKSVEEISDKRLVSIDDARRYPGVTIKPMGILPINRPSGLSNDVQSIKLNETDYFKISQNMPELGWTLSIFTNTQSVEYDQMSSMLTGLFFIASIIGIWLFLQERQARLDHLESSRRELESRVIQRTQDLEVTNSRLVEEIEERNRAEYQLKAAQDGLIQAAKLATLGQMSAGINHELNQPLTAIKAFSSNAAKFLERGKLETVDQNLQEIRQQCDRMGKIISQFKLFSRKSDSKLVAIDFQQIITGAYYIIQPMLDNYPGQLLRRGIKEPVWVAGDMVRLEQVMVNLLSNAIQATVDAHSPEVEICFVVDGSFVELQVKDNGTGLVNTNEIFEPFFTTKAVSEGLGLGLSISRQIIEAMNGTLEARDAKDSGAIFVIRLPLLKQPGEFQ